MLTIRARARPLLAIGAATLALLTACGNAQTFQLLDLQRTGDMEKGPTFTVNGPWQLRYSYDCTGQGNTTGLVVQVINQSDDSLIAESPDIVDAHAIAHRKSTADVTVNYQQPGTLYLQVQSGCGWRVQIRERQ